MRLCMVCGIDAEISIKNGTIIGGSESREGNLLTAYITHQLTNSTDMTFVKSLSECIEMFSKNESDFSTGEYVATDGDESYYVPLPTLSSSLFFVSGYEVNEYRKMANDKQNWSSSEFGILNNLSNFELTVYLATLLWLLMTILLILSKVIIRKKKLPKVKYLLFKSFRLIRQFFRGKSPMNRTVSFSFFAAFFFIATPFQLLFKTNQVVTPKQPFLANYKQVIAKNAQVIYSSILFDETIILEPLKLDEEPSSIQSRFWRHFKSNSRKVTFGTNLETLSLIDETARKITQQKAIYLAPFPVSYSLMQAFCSFSNEPDLYRMFYFQDESQREFLTGFAMRKGYENKWLLRRIRNLMESNNYHHIPIAVTNFVGFMRNIPKEHMRRQFAYCLQDKPSYEQIHSLEASGLRFFEYFFDIFFALLAVASVILVIEKLVRKKKKNKIQRFANRRGREGKFYY